VEDDYDSEFRFGDRPLEPIARLDERGRVIYVGSFSKILSPSLRLGFLVAPGELVAPLVGLRKLMDWGSPAFLQRALAGLVADGELDRHLRRARRTYRARHQLIADWLTGPGRRLGTLLPSDAGLHLTVELAAGIGEAALIARARTRGVAVEGLASYAINSTRAGLALGYGTATTERLSEFLPVLLGG
jgi:GntR family transcriptional regulator/MocR family aminotransferase